MTDLLCKIFIKNKGDVKNTSVRNSYGKLAGAVSIICNVILALIKFVAGTLGGGVSVSIIADAVNNLSDASSGFISLMGFKLAEKPADSEHPYGHGRYEYISGLTVSALILVIGTELLRSGIDKIISPEPRDAGIPVIIILVFSVFMKIWMCLFNRKLGKKISSETLLATGADNRNDVITTTAVLIGFVVSPLIGFDLDGYIAVAVAIFILISGIGLIKDTIAPLLGKSPDVEFVKYIEEKIMSYPKVLGLHELMIHDYGPGRQFGSVHVEMPAELDIMEGHDIIDTIERDFLKNDGFNLTIHYDPIVTNDPIIGELKSIIKSTVSVMHEGIAIHDLRIVPGGSHTNVIFDCVIPYGADFQEKTLHDLIQQAVSAKFGNYYVVIKFENSFTG